jgi:hypothetical protein
MAAFLRATVLLLAVPAAFFCLVRAGWMADLGLDFWSIPALLQQTRAAEERQEQLAEEGERIDAVTCRKDEVVEELIAGRTSLRTAAAEFCRANPETPACAARQFRHQFPDASEQELVCRHVIHWARETLADQPERCAAVVARLEQDLRDLLKS